MYRLLELVPSPDSRVTLDFRSFTQYILPLLLCYNACAILVLLPKTIFFRLAILPIALWYSFLSFTRIRVAAPYSNINHFNFTYGLVITALAIRIIRCTFTIEPLKKVNAEHDQTRKRSTRQLVQDALELSMTVRGLEWTWSKGIRVAAETRPTKSRAAFVRAVLASYVLHILTADLILYLVQKLNPALTTPVGGSIFDPSLPAPVRYASSTVSTSMMGLMLYCLIQATYDIVTLQAIVFQGDLPSAWPPLFNSPWKATSITQFWANGWHQLIRDSVISVGYNPGVFLFGRFGGVLGAFFVSGLIHHWGVWAMGMGTDFIRMVGFFMMMGIGIILEEAWKAVTGKQVKGMVGWLWMSVWTLTWAQMFMDVMALTGIFGCDIIGPFRPIIYVFGSV